MGIQRARRSPSPGAPPLSGTGGAGVLGPSGACSGCRGWASAACVGCTAQGTPAAQALPLPSPRSPSAPQVDTIVVELAGEAVVVDEVLLALLHRAKVAAAAFHRAGVNLRAHTVEFDARSACALFVTPQAQPARTGIRLAARAAQKLSCNSMMCKSSRCAVGRSARQVLDVHQPGWGADASSHARQPQGCCHRDPAVRSAPPPALVALGKLIEHGDLCEHVLASQVSTFVLDSIASRLRAGHPTPLLHGQRHRHQGGCQF